MCIMSGCSSSNTNESYYDRGLDLISLSHKLASDEEYVKSYNITEEQKGLLSKLTELENSKPAVVFSLDIAEKSLNSLPIDAEKCSEDVRTYLLNNTMTSIPSIINGKADGSNFVIASTVASASMAFDHKGAEASVMYLYVFEGGVSYAVNFMPGYDNSVYAVAAPIFDEALSDCKNVDDVVNYLKTYRIFADPSDISVIVDR